MIDLHYVATANGLKVAILLMELGVPHRVVWYDLFGGHHLTSAFRKINPNNKLPAIIDHEPADGGAPLPVFESCAILLYLAEKHGMFLPQDPRRLVLAKEWLIWQAAGLGPMHGQAHHFVRYAPSRQPYPTERYLNEARRLLNVLEYRLSEVDYLAEDYSIADMAAWPWVGGAHLLGIDIADFPAVSRWVERVGARPAVIAAVSAKETAVPAEYMQEHAVLTPEQWSNMFGDKMLAAATLK